MSKKQKRQVSRSEARAVTTVVAASTTTTTTAAPTPRSSRLPTVVEFNPDYSYVMTDLKRIGILAVAFVSILVILTFFLR